jgi:hypothetical protein
MPVLFVHPATISKMEAVQFGGDQKIPLVLLSGTRSLAPQLADVRATYQNFVGQP